MEYFQSVELPNPTPSNAEVFGIFAESLSPILTIIQSIKKFNLLESKSAEDTLHLEIIGSTINYEGSFLPAFEEILHQLPSLTNISITFIGLEIPLTLEATHTETFLSTCPECTKSDRKISFEWRSGLYHELKEQKELKNEVDLVIIFSSGVGLEDWDEETFDSEFSPWTGTFDSLLETDVPILMVANTEEEAKDDFRILATSKGSKASVTWGIERNIWCGGDVHVDVFEQGGMWRRNEWTFGIKGKK